MGSREGADDTVEPNSKTNVRIRQRSYTRRPPDAVATGEDTAEHEDAREHGDDGARAPRPTQANPLSEPEGRPYDRRRRSP